jgi:hypothetical protein
VIDNKRLSEFLAQNLAHVSYETQVAIWDKNCSSCPFKTIRTISSDYRNDSIKRITEYSTLEAALDALLFEIVDQKILRGCNFGGEEYSLLEIVMNTCRFWNSETIEGGDNPDNDPTSFIIVDEGDFDVKQNSGALRKISNGDDLLQQGITEKISS